MIHIGLVNLNRSWLLVLLLAIGCSTSGWSKSLYPWNDASALCEWQATSGSHSLQLPFYGIEEDTISPALPDFVCDAVCPDFQVTWISIDADCGQSNGSATVTPVGLPAGTEFVYNWEGGVSTGPTAENLAPGVYKVTIGISELLEDQALRDCLIETEVVIDTKEGPAVEVGSITAGNCATLSGGVKLDISGGTPPYQISWGDGGSNTLSADGTVSISGLAPGDYTFIVRDAAGCLTSLPVTIPQAQEPISLTATPPSLCSSDDGTITVTMEEGFPPYTIILNDGLEITTNNNPYTFEGLPVGLYTVKVEYGFVCEAEASIELNTPGFECNEGWSVFDPVCPGDPAYLYFDGSGTANETYQVRQVNAGFLLASVPGNEAVFIEVQYGDYEIRRISSADNCFCEFMLSVEPVTLEAQLTVLNGSCEPGNIIPGSITLNAATGGTPPYTLEVTDLDGNPVDASNLNEGSYIATVRDANNCPLSDTVAVEGGALSGGIEEQEVVVCEGDTFQPSFENATNPNLIFSWSPTTGLSDSTIGNPVITPTEDITYVLNITDPNCGSFSDTLVIDFVPGLNLSVDGNAFQFGQDEITITVSSDSDEAIYTWFQNDGTVVDDDGNDTFILAADDLASPYTVVGEVNGCPDTLTFPVLPPPEADYTISVPDIEICEGEEGTLMATIIPDTILIDSIVWNDAQGQTAGQGSELLISGLSPGSYTYTATAFSPVGITQTNALVTVLPLPGIDAQPDGVLSLCITDQGNLVELTATATGYPDSMIVWTASDGAVLGNGGMVMVQAEAGTSQYVATLSAVCGEVSDTVTIEVDTEPALPALPDTLKLCIGDEAVIELSDYAFPYTWSDCDGQAIPVSGDSIIVSGDVVGETCFRFSASNECGTVEAEVTVYVVPEQVADAQPNDTIQFCIPAPDTCLAATVIGLPNDCIEWTDLSGNLLGTGSELCVTPPQGTSQYIANVPGLDCITADTVTIVVEAMPPPPPDLPDTLTICINQDTLLDLSSYSHPYTWASCDGQVIATNNGEIQISGTQPGEDCYTFSASNICGEVEEQVIVFIIAAPEISAQPDTTIELCAPVTDSLILTATAPGFAQNAIAWFSEDGDALGTGGTLSVLPATGTSHYIASISAACGTATDTVTIVVDDFVPPLPPGLPDTLKICVGNDILIDLSTYGYPYVWSDCQGQEIPVNNNTIEISGNEAGEQCFRFSASNACGAIEEQITVYVVPEQQVDAQPNDTLRFCAPAPDTCLTATVIDLPDDCIEWSDLDGNILGTGGELCVTPGVGLNHYIASVSGLACVTPDTITVIVDNLPMTPPALPDTLTLCIGQDTVFDLSGYGFPYSWSACDGQLIQENSNEIEINATALGEACYSFNASNACDTVEVDVIVYVIPEPVIEAQPDSTIALCGPVNTAMDIFATADGFADSDITWTSEDGAVLGTGTTLSVLPVEGVNQYIAITPQLTCGSASDTVTIVVETLPSPPPVALPDTLKLCVGDEAVIDLSGYGFPYTWSACGGAEIPVANDEIIILGDQAGEFCYEFGASNACGMTSAEVIVYVVPEQTVDAQPDLEIELCAPVATDTCLTATVTGLPGDCIEWTDFDGNVLGTGNELCVTPPEGTSYYIAGVPGLGCITSDTVTIVVETLPPPPPVALPDTLKLCVGDEAVIDLSGYGFPYTWSVCGGAEIPVANDEIIILGDQAGEFCYEFGASNACGMTSAEVIVYVVPEQTVDAQPDLEIELCAPVATDTCLTATVTGLPGDCIEWTDFDGNVLGTGNELCVTPPEGTSYYIAGVPGLGCITSDTVTIVVETLPPPPPVALPDTLKLCVGDEAVIDLSGYGFPYTWSVCGGAEIPVANDEIIILGDQAGEFCYEFGASNACGMTSAEVIVYVVPEQTVDAQPDLEIELCAPVATDTCLTATVTGLPGDCIEWTDFDGNVLGTGNELCVTPPEGTSYYIAGVPGLGCITSDTVTIVVETLPPPPPVALPDTLKLCVGDEAVIDLSGYGFPYTWSACGGAEIPVANDEIIILGDQAGEFCYEFGASNACGMTSAEVIVYVVPEQTVDAQPDLEIELCAPVATDTCLTATVTGLPGDCIEWTDFDGNVLGTGNELCVTPPEGTSYYIAGVPGLGCITSDTVTIVVETLPPPPPVALPDTLKLCVGDEAVIDLSGYGFPYTWSVCGGAEIPVANDEIIILGDQAGEFCYEFGASNACGMTSAEVIVYVVPEQTVDAQPDLEIELCAPVATDTCLTATVTGLPGDCIEWTDFDGNVLGTGNELCVTPPEGTSYYIAGVPGLGCITSDTVTIVVETLPPPPPVALPDTLKLCVGDEAVIDLSGYGFPYTWSACGGAEIPVANDEIIILGDQAGEFCYEFGASNACGMTSAEVIVYVVPEQTVDAQPDLEIELCAPVATDTCLTATVTGLPGDCIEWTDFDGNVLGTGNELCVTPPEGTSYYIAGVPGLGCITSDTVTIVVETLPPPPPVALPDTLKLCVGDEAVIDLSGYGFPYTWSACGGAEIPVANDEIIILGDQAGEFCYEFGASNACGMTSAQVIVYVVPEQTVDAQPDLEIELCAPVATDTCLTATVTGLPGDCIEWTDFDGNVLGTGNELCVTPPEGTSYYIAGVPGLGCITSDTVTIVVETLPPPPPVALPDTLKLCVGDEAVIDLSGYGFPYTWSACGGAEIPVANDEIIILGDQAGEFCYEFGASNACGMTSAQVIVYVVPEQTVDAQPDVNVLLCTPVEMDTCLTAAVTGLPDECIEWTDLEGTLLGTGGELCVTPPVGISQYIASVPGLDCIISDTVTVMVDTIPPVLPPSLPDTVLLCLNDTLSVTVGDYDYPFVWEDENGDTVAINEGLVLVGAEAGTASFIFEATNGCGVVADTLVQVTIDSAAIEIIPSVDTLVVCDSFAIQLNALAPLGQAVVWTDGEGNVIDTAISIEIMPQPGSSIYIANPVELGCVSSDTIVVEYVPEDLMLEINTPSLLICLGDEASLEAALDPEDVAATISWYDEAFVFIGEGEVIGVTPTRAGLVSYFAIAENACAMDTASIEIEVEALDLAIVGGDTSICTGDFATLEVVGCDNCTYEWTPEDRLTNPDAAITDAEPLRPSTFQVIVTGEVCRDTLTTTVDVGTCERCEVDKVFIADAFTPNGDQNNDQVCVQSEVMDQFSEIELMIYNRWGQEVFRSNDMQNLCWDGFFGGEDLPPDVYGYYMRIVCPGEEGEPDQVFTRQGNITLLR